MRPTALIPALCCAAALVLSLLCLFAGNKPDFMESYDLLTLNTSAVGETFLNASRTTSSSNPLSNLLTSLSNNITSEINEHIGAVASRLGIEDFYSAHLLTYCQGQYTPTEAPNATLSASDITKNITACSPRKAMYRFDPTRIVSDALNKTTGARITLSDINWPSDIDTGVRALNTLMAAMFVLYVLAIIFIFLSLLAALVAALSSPGRASACVNLALATLAWLAIAIASALVTAVMIRAVALINKYGGAVGVVASRGGRFLALTWAATGLMAVVLVAWIVGVITGRRRGGKEAVYG